MTADPVIAALTEQVACYQRLAKLAEAQHDHIQHARTEELLDVLQRRQTVLDQLAGPSRVVQGAREKWGEYVARLGPEQRQKAESLLAQTRTLLEQITHADRNDVMVLQNRKLSLSRQINQTTAARQVNRLYAAAAYGKAPSRVDVQR